MNTWRAVITGSIPQTTPWRTAAIAALLAAVTACASGSERQRVVSAGPVPPAPARRRPRVSSSRAGGFLESVVITPPGGKPITLKGSGVLTYDDFGNLEMNIKADEASSDLLRAGGITIP